MSTVRLAIDLGTSHTVAVVRRGDEAPRPVLFDGSPKELMREGVSLGVHREDLPLWLEGLE